MTDDHAYGQYEGNWSPILCGECELSFEVEDDVNNNDELICPDCGALLLVEGG